MTNPRFLLSLITKDNDFQREQASAAESLARELKVEIDIVYADSDPITQSQQLLGILQSSKRLEYKGYILEPAGGTSMTEVARVAVREGAGWVVINREIDCFDELRRKAVAPLFSVSADHVEVGRIQGRQFRAILPEGGSVLYLQGPSASTVAQRRTTGMQETKPRNITLKTLKCVTWTEAGGHRAVSSWMQLSVARKEKVDLVSGQNDLIAAGARKLFQEHAKETDGQCWENIRYTGVDGIPRTGQAWTQQGILAATVVIPPLTVPALRMLVQAIREGFRPPEKTSVGPFSFPDLEKLGQRMVAR